MSGAFEYLVHDFDFPVRDVPTWAPLVERWYQLDAYAYGLPQAFTVWKERLAAVAGGLSPGLIIFASPEGSNRTDREFARSFQKTGIGSPSKFVHTLPNSRSSALLQVMGWSGPIVCVQNDPATIVSGIAMAFENQADEKASTWVLSVTGRGAESYRAHLFVVSLAASRFAWSPVFAAMTDAELLASIESAERAPDRAPDRTPGREAAP